MSRCSQDDGLDGVDSVKAVARTLTTIAIALGSTIVLALAGCASSAGIAPSGAPVDPADVASPPPPPRR